MSIKKEPDFDLAKKLMFNDKYHHYVAEIMAPINDFFKLLDTRTRQQVQGHIDSNNRYFWYAVSVFIVLSVVIILSFLMIYKKISVPVGTLSQEVRLIGNGDLTRDIRSDSKDEIGELSRIVDEMRKKVGQTVGESMCIAVTLADAASQQAASVEETSSSLEEMSSMTKQNAENANNANNLMKEANQVIVAANQSMGGLPVPWKRFQKPVKKHKK